MNSDSVVIYFSVAFSVLHSNPRGLVVATAFLEDGNILSDPTLRRTSLDDLPIAVSKMESCLTSEDEWLSECPRRYRRKVHLVAISPNAKQEDGIFLFTYHSVLRSAIDLMIFYRRFKAWFLIDKHTGFSEAQLSSHLREFFEDMDVTMIKAEEDIYGLLSTNPSNNLNFVVICSHGITERILTEAAELEMFQYNNTWIVSAHELTDTWRETLKPVIKSDVAILKPSENAGNSFISAPAVYVYDVFNSSTTGEVEAVKFANWTVRRGVFVFEEFEANDIVTKAKGRTIRPAAFHHLPYTKRVVQNNETVGIAGHSIDSVNVVGDTLGMNVLKPIIVPSLFGDVNLSGGLKNKTLLGMAIYLVNKEADVAASVNALALSRTTAMNYLFPAAPLDLALAYKTPPSFAPPTIFFLPFAGSVWAVIFLALAIMVSCIALIMVWSPAWRRAVDFPSSQLHSTGFRLATGTFFDEALTNPPGVPARVVYAALLVATTLSFILYTSVVTSFLSFKEVNLPINTVKDLVENHKFRPVYINSSVLVEISRTANVEVTSRLWKKAKRYGNRSLAANYDRSIYNILHRPEIVVVGDSRSILGSMDNVCLHKPTIIVTPIVKEFFYFISRLDLPYNRMIYMTYLRMQQYGISRRIRDFHGIRDSVKCDKENESFSFTMTQALAPFCILLAGLILSVAAAITEKCIFKNV